MHNKVYKLQMHKTIQYRQMQNIIITLLQKKFSFLERSYWAISQIEKLKPTCLLKIPTTLPLNMLLQVVPFSFVPLFTAE